MPNTRLPRGPGAMRFGPIGAFTPELAEAFLSLVEQTGNYRAAARILGHRHLFSNRMYRHPEFRHRCEAAAASADARLREAPGPLLAPVEIKAMPPDGTAPRKGKAAKRPTRPEQIIRRASNGRLQISHVRDGCWTSEVEADFLGRLRATGNFDVSARATGFQPSSLYRRIDEWPAFARACREALDAAEVMLDHRLVAHAHALLLKSGETEEQEIDAVPFDPEAAMRILAFLDRRKAGRTGGRHKGAPERSFAEVVQSIMTKIAAIQRHEAMSGKKGDDAEDGPSPAPE
ncbi:MAG TPA: hypothetical protein VMG08_04980 [Allosphingosinicella sp.]|nr:hypothetical protein [Allosphingosinicella sp.]